MSPKADTTSSEGRRQALYGSVRRDCFDMAEFRSERWADDGSRWTPLRMLDCMIQTFQENHADDPTGGWDARLDVSHDLRRELGRVT